MLFIKILQMPVRGLSSKHIRKIQTFSLEDWFFKWSKVYWSTTEIWWQKLVPVLRFIRGKMTKTYKQNAIQLNKFSVYLVRICLKRIFFKCPKILNLQQEKSVPECIQYLFTEIIYRIHIIIQGKVLVDLKMNKKHSF